MSVVSVDTAMNGNLAGVTKPDPVAAPATLRWAVAILAGQALVVAALTGLVAYETLVATSTSPHGAIALLGSAAAAAALLGFLGYALTRRRAWARGPAVVLELMLLPIGYYMIKGSLPLIGVPVLLLGLGTAGLLIASPTRQALGGPPG